MIVRSQASVSYAYSLGNLRINSVVSSNAVDTEIRTVKLLGKKTASHEFFRPGDVITYNLVITNTGNFAASNVLIEDELSYQKLVEGSFTYSFLENSKAEARLLEKAGGLAFEIDELRPTSCALMRSASSPTGPSLTTSATPRSTCVRRRPFEARKYRRRRPASC